MNQGIEQLPVNSNWLSVSLLWLSEILHRCVVVVAKQNVTKFSHA